MDKSKQSLVTILVVLSIFYQVHCTDLTYTIPEEQPVNTVIGHILNDTANLQGAIQDKDVPHLKFTFLSEGNAVTSLFALDSQTGQLAVGPDSTLDSETICPFYEKCHIKLDVVIQSPLNDLFRKVSIKVILEDVNDNPPTFPNDAITVDVSEAVLVGASIPLEGASDRDMGKNNSLQSYEIEPRNDAFGLSFRKNLDGTSYLNLVVQGELDHEKVSSYSLRVVAKDGGDPQLQGVMTVNVTITDVNDNVPKFKKDNYSVSVDENVTQNSVIIQVQAVDRDSGENGQISYKLSSHQDTKITTLFKIDPESGDISVKSDLQNEATEIYNIIVEAIDHALQPFTSQSVVTVTVRDVINSPPKLTVNMLSGATISEYANIGAAVAHVAVKESDRGRNGIVSCDLKNTTYFNLQGFDLDEYKIIVAQPLDAELVTSLNIDIVCEDAGSPPLSVTHSFEITITDENDNSPIFVKPLYTGTIKENNREGQSVVTVRASDEDAGLNGRVKYSLGSDATDNFRISQDGGVIRSNVPFDYETQKFANFTVVAYDQGTPKRSASTIVSIKIEDINDEAPRFSKEQFSVEVSEYAKPGEFVAVIKAFDFESGKNGDLMYFLLNKTPSIPFTMFVNGSMVLDEALDYEKKQAYEFKVMAVDKGEPPLNTTTNVVIQVLDENDNKPIISFPNVPKYLVNVTFSDKKSTVITRLRVIDLDSGLNGQLHYVITSRNDSGRFEINAKTGELFTTKSYDYEDIDLYRLVITVKDNGAPPFADHTTVFIKLSQGNGTAASAGASSEQNILITLTIVCVTIIISATIVLIIVIMRRRDRKKQSPLRNHHLGNNDPTKYDSILKSNNINDRKEAMMDEANSGYGVSYDKMAALQTKDNFDLNPKVRQHFFYISHNMNHSDHGIYESVE
ncbi:hypothetical protein LOTGIDRAFT_139015 [Lottia gigantea]|uniref:Cadherin domain-containing protein n=1 Tax=Lottia gigantea TaxID=225164 RepID=V4ACR2_LOTGI|nr:hypothetical protein LOTGIDRAFT_139015 [Lottia gigantea]ESP01804.1 hypothetical protein LOTGIDRAFT_139015 [Lottia gigantea]